MPLRPRLPRPAGFAGFVAVLACMTLLGVAAYDSALRGLTDWESTRLRNEVRRWVAGRPVASEEQWQRAVDALRAALRVAPHDPELWESLGLAYNFGSWKFAQGSASKVYIEFALIYYRQAAVLRPTSPYGWAGVALMKFRLDQLDEEFGRAFASAMRLGPWEPGVQIVASDIGLALWDRLDPPFKDQVRETWRRTAVRQADRLATIAIAHGRADILCKEPLDALKNRLKCAR